MLVPSSPHWVKEAIAHLPIVLLDHAHCEKKAALAALQHVMQHSDWPALAWAMSRLAREELVHFERVLSELERRDLAFRPLSAAGYGAALYTALRPPSANANRAAPSSCRGDRTVDELLVCALIETRSHERLRLLAENVDDSALGALYRDLCKAEERHGELYLELAKEVQGGSVEARWSELCAHEAQVIARTGLPIRMHSG